jgi:hypothetical protein
LPRAGMSVRSCRLEAASNMRRAGKVKYARVAADLWIFKLNREAIYVSCGFAQRSPILGYHVEYCL